MSASVGATLFAAAAGKPSVRAGETVSLAADRLLLNDWQGYRAAQLLGEETIADPSRILIAIDHESPAGTVPVAEQQKMLIELSQQRRLRLSQNGGVGYSVLLEEGLRPGETVACMNSRCGILGAAGALALRVSAEEMAALMKGGCVERVVPETVRVALVGTLHGGATARDVLLTMVAGGCGALFAGKLAAFSGELSEQGRRDLCAMARELGAEYAVWTKENGEADLTVELSDVRPMAALPGSLEHIRPVSELTDVKLDAVSVGGCLGGGIEDLRRIAALLKGRRVAHELRLMISPATAQVQIQAMNEGLMSIFLDAGAHLAPAGCGACKPTAFGYMEKGEVLLSAGGFNYTGCAGHPEAQVYLTSVETAVASALAGHIAMPEL